MRERIIAACKVAPDSRRHHFVPQGYMKAWTEDGALKVWDTEEGRVFTSGTRDVCVTGDYFTAVMFDEQPSREVEGFLSVVDNEFARLLDAIRSTGELPESKEDRANLGYLIALQTNRVPQRRRTFDDIGDYLLKVEGGAELKRRGIDPDSFRMEAHNNSHIRVMAEVASEVSDDWIMRDWTLAIAVKPWFITCDSPVLWDWERGGAINAEQVLFPISPTMVLMLGEGRDMRSGVVVAPAALRDEVERLTIRGRDRWIIGTPSQDFFRDREGKTIRRRRQMQLECVEHYEEGPKGGACLMKHTYIYAAEPVIKSCGRHR